VTECEDDRPSIIFLYQLVDGIADRSYGLNVARLAGINDDIIQEAELLSSQLERKVQKRRYVNTLLKSDFDKNL
jgi:DNA mismatch repair ATPase MutS